MMHYQPTSHHPWLYWRIGLLGLLLWLPMTLQGQDITVKEGADITYQAKRLVGELENYLNTISNTDLSESDIKEIIDNSYGDPVNKIFFDDKVIIEDDVDPASNSNKKKDFEVNKYLRNFDLMYTKSTESSITFTNLTTSNLKKKDFYYIKVYFESAFTNAHRNQKVAYSPQKRVATIRADKQDKKWKTYLVGIRFYTPEEAKTANVNDVKFAKEVAGNNRTLRGSKAEMPTEASKQAIYEQEKQARDKEYSQALASAQEAEARQDYPAALENYKIARELSRRLTDVKKVVEIERIIQQQNNWQLLLEQGNLAAKRREYSKAVDLYKQVLRIKPDQTALLDKINTLTKKLESVSVLQNLFQQGKYDDALKECNRRLKKEEDRLANPELQLLRGRSYVALEKYKNAQEEFDAVIQTAPDYLEARILRSDLYERKSEWANAIAEYDVILQSIAPKESSFYTKKASLQVKANNSQAAIADYEKAIQYNLKNPLNYVERGLLYFALGDFDKAKLSFDSAIRLDPTYVRAYFQRGKTYLQLNRNPEAIADFEKARQLGLDKTSTEEILQLSKQNYRTGVARFEQKQYQEAIQQFDQALLLKPNYTEAWLAKGDAYFQWKNYSAAKDSYTQTINQQPTNAEAYFQRGLTQAQLQDYASAIKDYQKATSLRPEYIDAHINIGRAQIYLKEYAQALVTYQRLIQLIQRQAKEAPRSAQASFEEKLAESYTLLGKCQYETKNYREALETFKTALSYNKNLSQAYYNRGMTYVEMNNPTKAIEDFSACLSRNSDRLDALYSRARAYEMIGKYNQAIAGFNQVLESKEAVIFKDGLYRRGACHAKINDYEAAISDYEAYARKYPQSLTSSIHVELGFLYLDKQKNTLALEKFKRANDMDRLNSSAMYGLAFAYAQLSKVSQSIEWLQKALKSNPSEWDDLKKEAYLPNLKRNLTFARLKKDYHLD
ncbi:MAG: tetratricopeptide repeat protein [Bacteroidota bacterium]